MGHEVISAYTASLEPRQAAVCDYLRKAIEQALPKANARIWHGMPVWFIGENPVVGYSAKLTRVTLRFWNGQSFGDPLLVADGKFRAAQIQYKDMADIDTKALRGWLRKARTDLWDVVATRNRILFPHTWMR